MLTPCLGDFELAIHDINEQNLQYSLMMLNKMKQALGSTMKVRAYLDRKEALRGASYVINAIQVGGYDAVRGDFEIPNKYGLRQTVADTIGIGGVFRALRTLYPLLEFAADMREVCPTALFLNYTNPMSVLTHALIEQGGIRAVGLCHSVQSCVPQLFNWLGMDDSGVKWSISGINHMAWLTEISRNGVDLYPEIKQRAAEKQRMGPHTDRARFEIMLKLGYYVTESSAHTPEYYPYFIKKSYPELVEYFQIPLDRTINNLLKRDAARQQSFDQLVKADKLEHRRSLEYASRIIEACETDQPFKFGGNVLNDGLITNLPQDAVVEVPCLADRNGISPLRVGELPEVCAALNRTQINTQLLTLQAAKTLKKEHVYHAAMLDPHTAAECSLDDIVSMCDELLEFNRDYIPEFR